MKIRRILCFLSSSVFLLFSYQANAGECGVLQLQSNKSSGVSSSENQCAESPYVSIGTKFELAEKGRLWLKSNKSKSMNSEFQMICQNGTGTKIQLEFSDMIPPWLNQSKLNNCTGWVNNQLSCDGFRGEKKAVLCVLSFKAKKLHKSKDVQRTTSVKMRDIKSLLKTNAAQVSFDKKEVLESIKQELKLCKKLAQMKKEIGVKWAVSDRKVTKLKILSETDALNNISLSNCIEMVISTIVYPSFEEETFYTVF